MTDRNSNRIARYDGVTVGVALFLDDDELRDAGIDPDRTDVVHYHVGDDGNVVLSGE